MNNRIKSLLKEMHVGLGAIYGKRLRGVYLYGSYARSEADRNSDIDLLIVLGRIGHYAAEVDRTGELCAKLSLEYDVSVSRVFVSARDWKERETPFLENVREDAVIA